MADWQGLAIPQLDNFTGFVPPAGDGRYGVMIVGEAPGEQEARYGIPFYPQAPAGAVLARLLRRAGLDRDGFVISNAVWSRPPGNYLDGARYEGESIRAFAPLRSRLFDLYRPRVIVAMGGVALRTLTNYGGKGASITACQGYVLDSNEWPGVWVIPVLHPSAIMRGEQRISGAVIWALQRAIDIAKNGFVRQATHYITNPTPAQALEFEHGYDPSQHILSYDIETPESANLDEEEVEDEEKDISFNITRISLCYEAQIGHAISLPWSPPYRQVATRMLASLGPKRVWNGNFDNPRLAAANAPVLGRIYDSMWAWKFLQPTLPRSLGFVAPFYNWTGEPWKHTSDAEPERYSCQDAHALQAIGDGVDAHLKQKNQWDVYERHCVQLTEVLQQMSKNGLPYDRQAAAEFEQRLQGMYDQRHAELQTLVPVDLKRPKQKTGYKKPPRDHTGLAEREFHVLGEDLTDAELFHFGGPMQVGVHEIYKVTRYCVLEPFNPGSPGETGQMADLIRYYGHAIGKNRKTKQGSVDDDLIKKLMKKLRASRKPKDQELLAILQPARECRQLKKVLGTYVKGWRPGRDGRIHSTPGFWGSMFRISWRNPNIAATIQDKQEEYVANGFRKCVAPNAGKVLIEADWKGIEAVLVGWFAGDQDYQRLARLGVHSFMASHLAGRPADLAWRDEDLASYFKEIKRNQRHLYDQAKHTVHGANYGMGPRLMADMYEMPEREARRLLEMYFGLFPRVRAWQKSVLDRASRECKLRNPFGYEMPFWEVYRWDSKKQDWVLGEDAKSAIAFLPRDTAAAMLKEVLLRLRWLADDGIMLACTHDSITCETTEADLMRVARILKTEMEMPVPELCGLSVGVDLKAGRSWHDDSLEPIELDTLVASVP